MSRTQDETPTRIGAVSFLNTLPLIEGLDRAERIELIRAVPANLPGMLESGAIDVGLVPVIDMIRGQRNWHAISDAGIASAGASLTVRVFSRVDPHDIDTLCVDRDSHTSVALASIIWRERYGRKLRLKPFAAAAGAELERCQAVLLIGDKVINSPPGLEEFSTHMDLGATWRSLTGLPFVFATWACIDPSVGECVEKLLNDARDRGVARAAELAARGAEHAGWPVDLAKRYLTSFLEYRLTDDHRRAIETFFELARRHDVFSNHLEPVFA